MATDLFSATAPIALSNDDKEENFESTWIETAVTVIAMVITALIVGSISMVMAFA